jgi:hypothetical protein
MFFDLMYTFSNCLGDIFSINHLASVSISDFIDNTMILAQKIPDSDIMGQIEKSWKEFVSTGRIWAMLIGVFLGYTFRSFLP